MKKDKITYPIVKKIRPLIFWCECRFCNREFKRESGFKIIDFKSCQVIGTNPFWESYCCNNCASNESDVKELINKSKLEFINRRPAFGKGKKCLTKKENILK